MYKSARVFTIKWPEGVDSNALAAVLPKFEPTRPTQTKSVGFVPPRGNEFDSLVETLDGHYLLLLQIQTRTVPAGTVREKVRNMAKNVEAATGRKPGKRERKEMAEEALLDLLPSAFPKDSRVGVWIDKSRTRMVIGSTVQDRADTAITELIRAVDGLEVAPYQSAVAPGTTMARWLADPTTLGSNFALGHDYELRATDETRALIRCNRYSAPPDEIRRHIAEGRLPTRVSLNWSDQVTFQMNSYGHLLALKFEAPIEKPNENADDFDSNAALMVGNLSQLLRDLNGELT